MPVDVGRLRRRQPYDRSGDVLRHAEAAARDALAGTVPLLRCVQYRARQLGRDRARRDRVHVDAEWGELNGRRGGELADTAFGHVVDRLGGGRRHEARRRADVHDAPPARSHHHPSGRLQGEVQTLEVHADLRVPVLFGGLEERAGNGDAGVVDENVEMTAAPHHDRRDHGPNGGSVGHVHDER